MKQGKKTCAVANPATDGGFEYSANAAQVLDALWLIVLRIVAVHKVGMTVVNARMFAGLNMGRAVFDVGFGVFVIIMGTGVYVARMLPAQMVVIRWFLVRRAPPIRYLATVPLLLAITAPAVAQPALVSDVQPSAVGNLPEPVYDGPLAEVGKSLHDNGIDLGLDYFNIYQNSPNFGFSSATYGGIIFDATGRLSPDLRVRFTETINLPAHNVGGYANVFVGPVRDKSDTDLTRLTLQADFLNDRLLVEAGRMGLSENFLARGFCDGPACVNSTQGATLHLPEAGLAVWGARAAYKLTPLTTMGVGIVENNTDNWLTGDGWDWQSGKADGYIGVANISHDETFMDTAYPLKFEIGAYRRSAAYNDALYDDGAGNPTFNSATPTIITHKNGTNGVYAQVRKVIWSTPKDGPIPENLAFYGGVFHTLGEGEAYPWEAYAGLEYSGFWAENPLTTIGASVHYIGLSEKRAQYERNARRVLSGLDQVQQTDTFMFDVHARTGLFDKGVLNAGAAYIVNPNIIVPTDFSSGRQKNGFFFYVALAFDLGGTLGLSPRRGP